MIMMTKPFDNDDDSGDDRAHKDEIYIAAGAAPIARSKTSSTT